MLAELQAWAREAWEATVEETAGLVERARGLQVKVEAKADEYKSKAIEFVRLLQVVGQDLAQIATLAGSDKATPQDRLNLEALQRRFAGLSGPFWAQVEPSSETPQENIGVAPLLVIGVAGVGVVAVSAAAIAWAVVALPYAQSLQTEAQTAREELAARVEASKEGRTLQQYTGKPPAPSSAGSGWGWALLALGGLGAAGAVGWGLWGRR